MHVSSQAAKQPTVATVAGTIRSGWLIATRRWQLLLLMAVCFVLYVRVLAGLVADWYLNPDYSHGFFVLALSLYLVWHRRHSLASVSRRPSSFGLLVVLGSLGLLFLGTLGAELFLTRISLLGTAVGLILYFVGWPAVKNLAFPLGFLLFAIPLPVLVYNQIVFPLQLLASRLATTALDTINLFPVVREGNILLLPYQKLEVVEACSGIRSLMSLLALATAYGYLFEHSRSIRILLLVAMIPLAVLSNGLRVMGAALISQYLGPRATEGFFHSFTGLAIFLTAAMLLLALHGLINLVRGRFRHGEQQ